MINGLLDRLGTRRREEIKRKDTQEDKRKVELALPLRSFLFAFLRLYSSSSRSFFPSLLSVSVIVSPLWF